MDPLKAMAMSTTQQARTTSAIGEIQPRWMYAVPKIGAIQRDEYRPNQVTAEDAQFYRQMGELRQAALQQRAQQQHVSF